MQQTMPTTVIDAGEGLEALQTVAPKALVTYERLVSIHALGIPKPSVPRALKPVDAEHPDGTPGWANNGYSVLQQHVSYFDFLTKTELLTDGRHLQTWFPSPCFPIYLKNVHKARHGSDSSV